MSNFGERLTAWYLRFNGFFLVENFVLHGSSGGARTADADLLAIRLKHSTEFIEGIPLTTDPKLVEMLGSCERNTAVIVQVKTGSEREPGQAFDEERLRHCLGFIGMAEDAHAEAAAGALASEAVTKVIDSWLVAKLFVAEEPQDSRAYLSLRLDHLLKFIEERLAAFGRRKAADRLMFPGELIQFLAWRAGQTGGRGNE